MKAKLVLIMFILYFMSSNYSFAGCNNPSKCSHPCYNACGNMQMVSSGCSYDDSCSCVDPACEEGNSCMSKANCCRAFGNIGR